MNTLLPEILDSQLAENQAQIRIKVAEDLACFPGHFPGFPILPGAVQLDWAMLLARQFLNVSGKFAGMEQIKFQSPILPGNIVSLNLTYETEKNRLGFSYRREEKPCSSGYILLST